jgi:hypothetical protein
VRRGSGARLSELVACVQAGTTQRRSPSNANRSQGSQLAGLIQPQLAAMAPGKTKPPEPEPESYPLPSEAPINTTYDVAVQSCKGDRFPLVRITLPLLTLAHPVRADWGLGRCRYARQSTFIRRTQARQGLHHAYQSSRHATGLDLTSHSSCRSFSYKDCALLDSNLLSRLPPPRPSP